MDVGGLCALCLVSATFMQVVRVALQSILLRVIRLSGNALNNASRCYAVLGICICICMCVLYVCVVCVCWCWTVHVCVGAVVVCALCLVLATIPSCYSLVGHCSEYRVTWLCCVGYIYIYIYIYVCVLCVAVVVVCVCVCVCGGGCVCVFVCVSPNIRMFVKLRGCGGCVCGGGCVCVWWWLWVCLCVRNLADFQRSSYCEFSRDLWWIHAEVMSRLCRIC